MEGKVIFLTCFLFGCITGVAAYGIFAATHMSTPANPIEIIQMYFAGGFGVITGGAGGIAIGRTIERKKKGK
jgi:hypothetical protein